MMFLIVVRLQAAICGYWEYVDMNDSTGNGIAETTAIKDAINFYTAISDIMFFFLLLIFDSIL